MMKVTCRSCKGSGKDREADDCKKCKGSGQIILQDPTQEGKEFWIEVYWKFYKCCAEITSCGSGKWLLFVNKNEIYDVWQKIRQDTLDGNLGDSSKVSTKRGWIHHGMRPNYVICVHTPNGNDRGDVYRVRDRLRELGFTSKIGYKTDYATLKGRNDLLYNE